MANSRKIRHDQTIPKDQLENCLKQYLKICEQENRIVYIHGFFGCKSLGLKPSMTLKEAYWKYRDIIDGLPTD